MNKLSPTSNQRLSRLWRYALAAALAWTALIAVSLGWSLFEGRREILDNARHYAQERFHREMLFRFWTDGHGSSAPATNHTPPSADVMRAGERALVSDPMLRQMLARSPEAAGQRSHLASLKPTWPENAADAWEAGALQTFVKGETEVASVATMDGQEYMRVMRPVVNEASCLPCHGTKDYKIGEIRGGMSVSVPLAALKANAQRELAALVIVDGVIWMLGLGGIGFSARRMQAHNVERARAETVLRDSEEHHRAVVGSANDAIVTINTAGEITGWNGAVEKIFHYTAAEMLGQPLVRILPPAGRDRFFASLKRIQAGDAPLSLGQVMEIAGQRSDGSVFPMELLVAGWQVGGERFFTGTMRDITARKQAEAEREHLIVELRQALAEIKTMSGLIPICSGCKKIRDDKNYWHQVESYVAKHTDAKFTHGLCPDCTKIYFPGLEEDGPADPPKEAL